MFRNDSIQAFVDKDALQWFDIIASFAVKPTSSILSNRETINKKGKNTIISVKGRHDPCVGIRAVPIGEAMMACVLLDHYLLNKAQCG